MLNAEPRMVDPREILKKSHRFDLVFKLSLAKAILSGDAMRIREAEAAYLESVRARNGFYEEDPPRDCPEDFLSAFRRTLESIRTKGFDPKMGAIPIDADGEVLNGAHRLVSCVACGTPCWVVESDCHRAGGSVMKTFLKGHIHPAVQAWGIRKYLELVPDGALASEFGSLAEHPVQAFPDWVRRTTWVFCIKPALAAFWWRLMLPFKRGEAAQKQRRRILRAGKQISGFAALAAFWKERNCGK